MNYKKILLTGSTGNLGTSILKIANPSLFLTPSRAVLDITKPETIQKFFDKNDFDAVIHCAAMARMRECHENPDKAIEVNTIGTANLVKAVIAKEKQVKKAIRFVHMSTDGVYEGTEGNYSEQSPTIPFNIYGLTKLGAECSVRALKSHCIIRTNFFEPENLKFVESAIDAYTSKVTIDYASKAVLKMLNRDFIGVINVGKERMSDYDNYKKYKPSLKPCKLKDILKAIPFIIAKDFSMDVSFWKKIEKGR